MKRIVAFMFTLALAAIPVFAQINITGSSVEQPQIAFRLFSAWVNEKQEKEPREKKNATTVMFTMGGVALAGAATTWFAGDSISQSISGSPMDSETKGGLSLGLAISGAGLIVTGIIVSSVPDKNYRVIYSDILNEQDPELQEAMAVAALKYQADRGKERRITSFASGLAMPIIAGLIKVGANLAQGAEWSDGVWASIQWSCWSAANGVINLFKKSEEERMYDRYLTARDALYGASAATNR